MRRARSAVRVGVLPGLSHLASRIALVTAARLPAGDCSCSDLLSPQPAERYARY